MTTRARLLMGVSALSLGAVTLPQTAVAQPKRYVLRMPTISGVATLGQVIQVMERTNVLQRLGLDVTFLSFPSAAQIGTALASGAIDSFLGSDIGLAGLLTRGLDETVVSSCIGWRFGFVVPSDSSIRSLADLRGKTVGIPFGVSTQVYLEEALQRAGLAIGKTVKVVNVPIGQIGAALQSNAVNAVGGWDPTLSQVPNSKLLYWGIAGAGQPLPSTIIAFPTKTIKSEPEAAIRYLEAMIESMWYAINHRAQSSEWFSKVSGIPVPVLDATLKYEPLWKARSITDINLEVTPPAIQQMNKNVQFFVQQKLFPRSIRFERYVDNSIVQEAQKRIREAPASAAALEVLKP